MNRFRRRRLTTLAVFVATAIACYAVFRFSRPTGKGEREFGNLLEQARIELAEKRFAEAERLANGALEIRDGSADALLLAAEAATRQGRLSAALEYYARVAPNQRDEYVSAMYGCGEIQLHQGRLSEGERSFRRALEFDPDHIPSNYRLAFLLGITGRSWEALPYGLRLIRRGTVIVSHLLLIGDLERVIKTGGQLEKFREMVPDDPMTALGLARVALSDNQLDRTEALLNEVLQHRPSDVEAHARLGHVLILKGQFGRLHAWNKRLPNAADRNPETWVVRGLWCRERNDAKGAVRCFREASLLAPNHLTANYQLGQMLVAEKRLVVAAPFLKRADHLLSLATLFDGFYRNWSQQRVDLEALEKIVGLMESLDRPIEAWGWAQIALKHAPGTEWAVNAARRNQPQPGESLSQTPANANPANRIDVVDYPLPKWVAVLDGGKLHPANRGATDSSIRFEDRAATARIDFRYFNSSDSSTPGARILETTGGGVAAIDYDGDGWPDLYFTQGAPWPADGKPHSYSDKLYRNLHDGRFVDVTAAAGVQDAEFGQGVAAGDFDGDGFPDLFVANLGRNRLLHNNGDGTFTDATDSAGLRRNDWTTSCLIADLNNDGLPDLYEVNYIAAGDLSRICSRDGKPMSCSPLAFLAGQDRVYLNRGNGRFEDVTDSAGIVAANGYGLGIVAADFSGTGLLNLFVANDQTSNFYFVNRSKPGGPIAFREQALITGLATDGDGKAQGCMGVAVGDADGDGRLDLFVSNFFRESNTLYVAQPGGNFVDRTRSAGLRTPSFMMLGFGTQFLDADLDGRPDLVVANGHIDDLRSLGEAFEMPTQFFHNHGNGRFRELPAKFLGAYFQKKWRGRGLARLDWNRDGLEDFVVSNINAPATLVTNVTQSAGRSLRIQLRGTRGSRDAIGATVRVRVGKQQLVQQLTAGDGYQASNQRQLVFGLGNTDVVESVEIRWPGGLTEKFANLSVRHEQLMIEGQGRAIPLPFD